MNVCVNDQSTVNTSQAISNQMELTPAVPASTINCYSNNQQSASTSPNQDHILLLHEADHDRDVYVPFKTLAAVHAQTS